jgi:hypothetical protein
MTLTLPLLALASLVTVLMLGACASPIPITFSFTAQGFIPFLTTIVLVGSSFHILLFYFLFFLICKLL